MMNCDGCVFREEGNVSGINMQLGCHMHESIGTHKELTDNGSWILSGLCQYKRNKAWQWAAESVENQMKIVRLESKITFDLSFTTSNEPWTEQQLAHIRSFAMVPEKTTAFYQDPSLYMYAIENGVPMQDQEHRTLAIDPELDQRVGQGRTCTSTYFGSFYDVRKLPTNFLYWMDHQINDNGYRFAYASSEYDVLLSTAFFKKVQLSIGNLKEIAEKYESYVSLDTLINNCNNNKNWNKGESNWV